MEDQNKLSLDHLAVQALRESAKWCMFLAIVGFIFIGLMVMAGVFMTIVMSAMPANLPNDPYAQLGMDNPFMKIKNYIGIIYFVFGLINFFPVYYLFNYAKGTKDALDSGREEVLSNALVNLKSHHKYLGIFTIVMLSLYVIGIIALIGFAASYASSGL
ncbi:hypothetical protein [Flavobacterium wongokense]|uniref:hypothetical protein n=1 Tax=Flavobacterium wongokense TaxID=2910674 RepID=UPI001F3F0A3B|nr:hypothetical protein [Flavobacterium sp. WG47]MCF6132006.1 hypothetical protein [Flavobacterium sp. WG47]